MKNNTLPLSRYDIIKVYKNQRKLFKSNEQIAKQLGITIEELEQHLQYQQDAEAFKANASGNKVGFLKESRSKPKEYKIPVITDEERDLALNAYEVRGSMVEALKASNRLKYSRGAQIGMRQMVNAAAKRGDERAIKGKVLEAMQIKHMLKNGATINDVTVAIKCSTRSVRRVIDEHGGVREGGRYYFNDKH